MSGTSDGAAGIGFLIALPVIAAGGVIYAGVKAAEAIAEHRRQQIAQMNAAAAVLLDTDLKELGVQMLESGKIIERAEKEAGARVSAVISQSAGKVQDLFEKASMADRALLQERIHRFAHDARNVIDSVHQNMRIETERVSQEITSMAQRTAEQAEREVSAAIQAYKEEKEQTNQMFEAKCSHLEMRTEELICQAQEMGIDCSAEINAVRLSEGETAEQRYPLLKLSLVKVTSMICEKQSELAECAVLRQAVLDTYGAALQAAQMLSKQVIEDNEHGRSLEIDSAHWSFGKFSEIMAEAEDAVRAAQNPSVSKEELLDYVGRSESIAERVTDTAQLAALNFLLAQGREYNAEEICDSLRDEGWTEIDRVYAEGDERREMYIKFANIANDEIVVEMGASPEDDMLNAIRVHCFEDGAINETARRKLVEQVSQAIGLGRSGIQCRRGTENRRSAAEQLRDFRKIQDSGN